MILGFKKQLADGTPTYFYEKIVRPLGHSHCPTPDKQKIHTIRKGKRWEKGMSIQMAYGVRTKYYWQFNEGFEMLSTCLGTQDIFMTSEGWGDLEITVSDKYLMPWEIKKLIENDGLTRDQFIQWFFPKGVFEFSGQIIHWTYLKY